MVLSHLSFDPASALHQELHISMRLLMRLESEPKSGAILDILDFHSSKSQREKKFPRNG
jgi:hypothetical protein